MELLCYSQRLLNPFRGTINIIRYQSAEAVTTDGLHWDIYVSNDELKRDLDKTDHVQTSDIRYGSWSEEKGLKRGPIYPSDDFKRMEQMGTVVYQHLLNMHQQLPFLFKDHYELWLLDTSLQPLALLNSVVMPEEMQEEQIIDWRAGLACRNSFTSAAFAQIFPDNSAGKNEGEYLTEYINQQAGDEPTAQWFIRKANGYAEGLGGINCDPAITGRVIADETFPAYFIRQDNHDALHQQLIEDFIRWQTPWLLTLAELDDNTRQQFEQLARKQALVVDKQFLLYPTIIDQSAINAARVEAMMRNNQPEPVDEEKIMSTFYLELSPSPTE